MSISDRQVVIVLYTCMYSSQYLKLMEIVFAQSFIDKLKEGCTLSFMFLCIRLITMKTCYSLDFYFTMTQIIFNTSDNRRGGIEVRTSGAKDLNSGANVDLLNQET